MTTVINPVRLSCFDSNNLILPPIPNDVTIRILRSLQSLVDFNSFATCSHSTLKSRSTVWLDWARRYGYEGNEEGSQKHLTDFFSCLANDVESNLKTRARVKFRKGPPRQEDPQWLFDI